MLTIKNEDVLSADLLSLEEAYKLPQWILANGYCWWLRSPGIYFDLDANINCDSNATIVLDMGYASNWGRSIDYDRGGIRPALTVANLPSLKIGETVEVLGFMAQYVGDNKVLLCEPIFEGRFDSKSNDYETSEVKQKIDEWFKRMKNNGEKHQEVGSDSSSTITSTSYCCPVCGEKMVVDDSVVLTTNPPQYWWRCQKCGHAESHFCNGVTITNNSICGPRVIYCSESSEKEE